MLKNGSFEDGWIDVGPEQQQPNGWQLRWVEPGNLLYDSGDRATGRPECTHKLAHQLPENEQLGAKDALILDGRTTYKVFGFGIAFGAELKQIVSGLQPGSEVKLSVPILAVVYDETDHYGAETGVWLIAKRTTGQWAHLGMMGNRKWFRHDIVDEVPESGIVEIVIRFKNKWPRRKDFFIDGITLEATPAPVPVPPASLPDMPPEDTADLKQALMLISEAHSHLERAMNLIEYHIRK